jgi:hypothetical protein
MCASKREAIYKLKKGNPKEEQNETQPCVIVEEVS